MKQQNSLHLLLRPLIFKITTELFELIIQASNVYMKLENSLNLLLRALMCRGTSEIIALIIQASNV